MGRTLAAIWPAPTPDTIVSVGHDERPAAQTLAAETLAPLRVQLLGRFELTAGGPEIRLARGAQTLIAILALKPRIRTREAVAAEIWPDSDGAATTASLRQSLWVVRSAFANASVPLERYLTIEPEVIGFGPCAPVELDVTRFETAIRGPHADAETAVALYRGDLLECVALECLAVERERLADAYEDALAEVAERRLAAGDLLGARAAAETLLARDPLREEAHAVLLQVHGRVGSRSQVIRQYRRVSELLERELGVEPLPETVAAYQAALGEAIARSRSRAATIAFRPVPGPEVRSASSAGRPGGLQATPRHR